MSQDVEVIQVIKTRLLRLGDGRKDGDPIRVIEQYWDMQGNLLWQVDPFKMLKSQNEQIDGG